MLLRLCVLFEIDDSRLARPLGDALASGLHFQTCQTVYVGARAVQITLVLRTKTGESSERFNPKAEGIASPSWHVGWLFKGGETMMLIKFKSSCMHSCS